MTTFFVFQAVAGVFAALASILFMVIASNVDKDEDISTSTRNSAYGYFGTACFVLLLCLLSILILNRMVSSVCVYVCVCVHVRVCLTNALCS